MRVILLAVLGVAGGSCHRRDSPSTLITPVPVLEARDAAPDGTTGLTRIDRGTDGYCARSGQRLFFSHGKTLTEVNADGVRNHTIENLDFKRLWSVFGDVAVTETGYDDGWLPSGTDLRTDQYVDVKVPTAADTSAGAVTREGAIVWMVGPRTYLHGRGT